MNMRPDSSANINNEACAVTIRRGELGHIDQIAALFDAYRLFYRRPLDPVAARRFIEQRIQRDESVIFFAVRDEQALGFTQLYPVFSSAALRRLWLLNELFVAPQARRSGVARALVMRAEQWARQTEACGLFLETAVDNLPAQALYKSMGYVRDIEFYRYDRTVD